MHTTLLALLLACGGADAPTEPTTDPAGAAAAEPAADAEPKAEPKAEAKPEATRRVFFEEPADGATVSSPVKIVFGVEGMEVKPAGELTENTGHHHIIIGPAGIETGKAVPKDEKHIHFGKGQTSAELDLPKGEHKLTMQFADGNHMSYGEVMAATITITVE